eukprot:1161533-Pelagomonas_calceolata.AAC.6
MVCRQKHTITLLHTGRLASPQARKRSVECIASSTCHRQTCPAEDRGVSGCMDTKAERQGQEPCLRTGRAVAC